MNYYYDYCTNTKRKSFEYRIKNADEIDMDLIQYYISSILDVLEDISRVERELNEICNESCSEDVDNVTRLSCSKRELESKLKKYNDAYIAACIDAKKNDSKLSELSELINIIRDTETKINDINSTVANIAMARKYKLSAILTSTGKWQEFVDLKDKKKELEEKAIYTLDAYSDYIHAIRDFIENKNNWTNAKHVIDISYGISDDDEAILKMLLSWYGGRDIYVKRAQHVIRRIEDTERLSKARTIHSSIDTFRYTGGFDPLCKDAADNLYISNLCDMINKYGSVDII